MNIDQSYNDDLLDVDVSKDTPNENSDAVNFPASHSLLKFSRKKYSKF